MENQCDYLDGEERCRKRAIIGGKFCRTHQGIGELVPIPKAGRPPVHGIYSKKLPRVYQDLYYDFFGDLNPFHELALARVTLNRMVDRLVHESAFLLDAEDDEILLDAAGNPLPLPETPKAPSLETLSALILSIERVVKMIGSVQDQITGKRVVVTVNSGEVEKEVRAQTGQFVESLLEWLPDCLCTTCRQSVIEEMTKRQMVMVQSGYREESPKGGFQSGNW